ncbi:MAG: autotransporter-associated beta strand repeat-containing protein [Desulfovibrio sp.]|nr:autotransporter-associated beta strand repeat-containing protein [Desulfovibrio sp.]
MTSNNTKITLDGTRGWDGSTGVRFKIIDLAGGKILEVKSENDGTYSFETLNIGGRADGQAKQAGAHIGNMTDSSTLQFNHTATSADKYYFTDTGEAGGTGIELGGRLNLVHTNGYTVLTGKDSRSPDDTTTNDIKGGTLQLGNGGEGGMIQGNISVAENAALVFNLSDAEYNKAISGDGSVIKDGAGYLTLSGENTYIGMARVKEGTLTLIGRLDSRLLTLHDGTTFDRSGGIHSLNDGQLNVHGHAAYTGNLDAQNAELNFYVPEAMITGKTMLTVSGIADIGGSTVRVGIDGASSPLRLGACRTLP